MASQTKNPGTLASDSAVGSLAWSNPTNAATNDGSDASATHVVNNTSGQSHYLKATNFGFTVPDGATINGITVRVEKYGIAPGDGQVDDERVSIVKADGTVGATDKKDDQTAWNFEPTYASYGGVADLWGETWTPAAINDADFGMVISALLTCIGGTPCDAMIDHVEIIVTYTEATTTSTSSSTSTTTTSTSTSTTRSTSTSSTSSSTSSTTAIDILFKPRSNVRGTGLFKPFGF